jgi:hypothetical protein
VDRVLWIAAIHETARLRTLNYLGSIHCERNFGFFVFHVSFTSFHFVSKTSVRAFLQLAASAFFGATSDPEESR